MHPAEILKRLDLERPRYADQGRIVESLADVTRFHAVNGSHHVVVPVELNESNVESVIKREIAHHAALQAPFEWTVYGHHAPSDILARLTRHGFSIGPAEAVLVLDLGQARAWIEESRQQMDRVRRVDDEDTLADFRRVAEAVFQKDFGFTTSELRDAIRTGSTDHRGYVAYSEAGEPVSVGRLYTHRESLFGGLYGGGTLPAFRGQGHYRATVAARARDAQGLAARFLRVDALPTSRPVLERLGFERVTDTWPCVWAKNRD